MTITKGQAIELFSHCWKEARKCVPDSHKKATVESMLVAFENCGITVPDFVEDEYPELQELMDDRRIANGEDPRHQTL